MEVNYVFDTIDTTPSWEKDAAGVARTRPLYTPMANILPKKVAYFYDSDIGNYAYVTGHPMKPHRIRLTHSLVMNYDVYKKMEIFRAKPANFVEMTQFHTDEYIEFLRRVTPDNMESYQREQAKFNVGDDCPVFDGLFDFCAISAGGSMEGAARLNRKKAQIAINYAGGLHHAKKSEASGFCYVNDIVLAIIELLRNHARVLYIDIDVHHGDGVEEAFYTTDRVMTASFHKYGEYFPGTGELRDIGLKEGKHHSVNFPLRDGITDITYKAIFEPVIDSIMTHYRPEAVVLQCGGDSLSGDRLGCFNLSMRGHANCVNFVRSYDLPTLVLGGGGYTMRNVARTWAYETGRLVGVEMDPVLPYNEYYNYYGPDYELDVRPSNMDNQNSYEYLDKIKAAVIDNVRKTAHVPSVQMQDVPRNPLPNVTTDEEDDRMDDEDEDQNADVRITDRQLEKAVARDDEFEEETDHDAPGRPIFGRPNKVFIDYREPAVADDIDVPNVGKKMGIQDYQNPYADADHEPANLLPSYNGKKTEAAANDSVAAAGAILQGLGFEREAEAVTTPAAAGGEAIVVDAAGDDTVTAEDEIIPDAAAVPDAVPVPDAVSATEEGTDAQTDRPDSDMPSSIKKEDDDMQSTAAAADATAEQKQESGQAAPEETGDKTQQNDGADMAVDKEVSGEAGQST